REAAESTEDDHRVAVEVVTVGDCELDERAQAVLGAAREALVNAAKHAGEAGPVRIYAEIADERIEGVVTDRGPGFALPQVPLDRRGVRESILGRMERAAGGRRSDRPPAAARRWSWRSSALKPPRIGRPDERAGSQRGDRR